MVKIMMKICPNCKRIYHEGDYYCLNDRYRLMPYTDEQSQSDQQKLNQLTQSQQNIPKCPTCQSTNIKKVSMAKKAVHGFAFGLFSRTVFSQFECRNCGYKW